MKPLNLLSPIIVVSISNPTAMIRKYSDGPKEAAKFAKDGARAVIRITPIVPPKKDAISASIGGFLSQDVKSRTGRQAATH